MVDFDPSDTAWRRIGDHVVFMDIRQDRYFRLTSEQEQQWLDGLAEKRPVEWYQPQSLPRPSEWQKPSLSFPIQHHEGFSLVRVAQALWVQKRIEIRLAERPFLAILEDLRQLVERRTWSQAKMSECGQAVVRSFEHARLLRSAKDRCLPRSIALASCLAASGDRSHVVFGVTVAPFTAHCWVQHGEAVLNDSLEEVQRYAPILVV